MGGVGAAHPHAERPTAAQARALLLHHRPRGGRRVPLHQLRAGRGDAPRAHGTGGKAEGEGACAWLQAGDQGKGTHKRGGRGGRGGARTLHGPGGRAATAGVVGEGGRKAAVTLTGVGAAGLPGNTKAQRQADALAQTEAAALLRCRAGVGRRARLLGGCAFVRVRFHSQAHDHAVQGDCKRGIGADAHRPGATRLQQRAQRAARGHFDAQRGEERGGTFRPCNHLRGARAQDRRVALPHAQRQVARAHWACAFVDGRVQHDHTRGGHASRVAAGRNRPHRRSVVAVRAQRDALRRDEHAHTGSRRRHRAPGGRGTGPSAAAQQALRDARDRQREATHAARGV